jgi:Outer membrane lipoprotein
MADNIRDENLVRDDNIQHGIDDNPTGDAEKGATLGGVGGAVVGGIAGAVLGPGGAIAGALIGGAAGAAASGAAVGAIDRVDNDNTISGIGDGVTHDLNDDEDSVYVDRVYPTTGAPLGGGISSTNQPGIQTGGYTVTGTPDTRGIMEKTADAVTGDVYDDKQGVPVANASGYSDTTMNRAYDNDPDGNVGLNQREELGETMPSLKTGGYANDGTPDTRGLGEKVVDAVTGDDIDDKTGKRVNHP